MKNTDKYSESIGKIFFDEITREPLWVLDDFIVYTKNFKIEWFIIKNSLFWKSKVIKSINVYRWSEDLFISKSKIKSLNFYENIKKILIEQNYIIRKKVFTETNIFLWSVADFTFSTTSFVIKEIIIKNNFFWLFFWWKEKIIPVKNILSIEKDKIIVKDNSIIKV